MRKGLIRTLVFTIMVLSCALHSQTGFIMGENGSLLRTTNGNDWSIIPTGVTNTLWSCYFITQQTGWIIGGPPFSIILKTTDEGLTWSNQYKGPGGWLTGAYFLNAQTGFAVGSSGLVLKTTNSGDNWNKININAGNLLLETIGFFDANTGWITGWNGKMFKTTNGGNNWDTVSSGTTMNLFTSYYDPSGKGWVSGGFGTFLLKTTNSGTNWTQVPLGMNTEFFSVVMYNNLGWLCGNNGLMLHTTDEGITWNPQTIATNKRLETVSFIDVNTGWVVGGNNGSLVFKTTNGGVNWVELSLASNEEFYTVYFWRDPMGIDPVSGNTPSSYTLYQNYPNPFNPVTKIKFHVPATSKQQNLTLTIYNELGEEVKTLLNQKMSPGTYEVEWNASAFSSGIYFYKLQGEDFVKTQKMSLVK